MYRKQVRRRRAVLLLLVAVSLTLLSLFYREGSGGPLHAFSRGVGTVFGPVQEGADRAFKPGRDLINWFDETFEARGQNENLEEEVAELRERLAATETEQRQSKELRRLLNLSSRGLIPTGREAVTARVIGRSPTVWYSTVTIDRGSSSGIELDDPVVTGDGLAGRVSELTPGTAQVTLITDHASSVAARVEPVGATGVIEPQVGNPKDLLLNFVERGERINEGQTVVTAGFDSGGLDSLFPAGIPIGRISEASLEEQGAYQRVHLKPFADLRDMEFVQALVRSGGKDSG